MNGSDQRGRARMMAVGKNAMAIGIRMIGVVLPCVDNDNDRPQWNNDSRDRNSVRDLERDRQRDRDRDPNRSDFNRPRPDGSGRPRPDGNLPPRPPQENQVFGCIVGSPVAHRDKLNKACMT